MDNNKEIKFDELPIYKVSLNQRLFLAASKKTVGKYTFVHTLECPADGNGRYNLFATIETATFDDAAKADVYYQTVLQNIDFMKNTELYKNVVFFNEQMLKNFKNHNRGR
ncbi:MAG: hypothetical protein J5611_03010 [Alphaproteobacteria bacterium]|nr:hypothetical protein [Alphaproteobacteria bacterium]